MAKRLVRPRVDGRVNGGEFSFIAGFYFAREYIKTASKKLARAKVYFIFIFTLLSLLSLSLLLLFCLFFFVGVNETKPVDGLQDGYESVTNAKHAVCSLARVAVALTLAWEAANLLHINVTCL